MAAGFVCSQGLKLESQKGSGALLSSLKPKALLILTPDVVHSTWEFQNCIYYGLYFDPCGYSCSL